MKRMFKAVRGLAIVGLVAVFMVVAAHGQGTSATYKTVRVGAIGSTTTMAPSPVDAVRQYIAEAYMPIAAQAFSDIKVLHKGDDLGEFVGMKLTGDARRLQAAVIMGEKFGQAKLLLIVGPEWGILDSLSEAHGGPYKLANFDGRIAYAVSEVLSEPLLANQKPNFGRRGTTLQFAVGREAGFSNAEFACYIASTHVEECGDEPASSDKRAAMAEYIIRLSFLSGQPAMSTVHDGYTLRWPAFDKVWEVLR